MRTYWGRAGAGVLPRARSTGRFLVQLRSNRVMEPNTWGVIGGRVDADEAPPETALREFEEETGQSAAATHLVLEPLYRFVDPEVGFQYFNFLGWVDDEFMPRTNWETNEWRWVTLTGLRGLKPKHFGLKELVADGGAATILKAPVGHKNPGTREAKALKAARHALWLMQHEQTTAGQRLYERFYKAAQREADKIAQERGLPPATTWTMLWNAAEREGPLQPWPGKDY